MRILHLAFTLLFVSTGLSADVIPDPLLYPSGLAGLPKENKSIAMIEEDLRIQLRGMTARVDVRFVLENSGPAVKLEVGFPPGGVENLKVAIDGESIKVRRAKYPARFQSGRTFEIDWFAWPMSFKEQQKRVIDLSYDSKIREQRSEMPATLGAAERDRLTRMSESRDFHYVLHTGAYWKGPIRRCAVRFEFDKAIPRDRLLRAKPAGSAFDGKTINWDLKDFEPRGDISISWSPNASRTELIDELVKVAEKHPADSFVIRTVGWWLASPERSAERRRIYEEYLRHPVPSADRERSIWIDIASETLDDLEKSKRLADAQKLARRAVPVAEAELIRSEHVPGMGKFGNPTRTRALVFDAKVKRLAGATAMPK